MKVKGKLVIDSQTPSFTGAKVYVTLEDVGRIDAEAIIIHQEILHDKAHSEGKYDFFEFQFESAESNSIHPRYNLRAHVDITGSGEVNEGDLVTTQSYPVRLGDSQLYKLKLKRV
jgi:hypothetical protein